MAPLGGIVLLFVTAVTSHAAVVATTVTEAAHHGLPVRKLVAQSEERVIEVEADAHNAVTPVLPPRPSFRPQAQLAQKAAQVPVPVAAAPAAVTAAPVAAAAPAGVDPAAEEEGFFQSHVYLLIASGVAGIGAAFALMVPQEKRQEALKKPFSLAAYTLGSVLFFQFLVMSLPFVGFLFGGCMWNSCHGFFASFALAGACLAPGLKLFDVPVPFSDVGLRTGAYTIAAAGGGGIGLATVYGDATCAWTFMGLNIALVVDALLLGMAWYQGEGGGILGVLRG
jgi:hypothetical protein